jgi:hypothetical protein
VSPSERSQHPLTSHVSGIREIRECEFNTSTCEVVNSENARGKANIASRGFVKGRCQGWAPRLSEWRSREKVRTIHLRKDRWQKSRNLANSEVRKMRAQELGAPSREWRNREEQG